MTAVFHEHPQFEEFRKDEWRLINDCMDGESRVKSRGVKYLPKPSGFEMQPDRGAAMYDSYKARAQFPEILAPSVASMMGIIHAKETEFDLPSQMDGIRERCTQDGLTMEAFYRRITRNLLSKGRYGVLLDAPADGGEPYFEGYPAECIINWDDDESFFVLDESGQVRNGFQWEHEYRYVVLKLEDGVYIQEIYDSAEGDATATATPGVRGGAPLQTIPFVAANALDLTPTIISPPLIGVANAARAIYQLSADYRHQLYMSGQETLVAINGKGPNAVGAGVVHEMNGSESITPDLKYVSPSCSGIEAHKEAMEGNKQAAIQAGAKMLEKETRAQESGEARKMRFTAETATLQSIAHVSAAVMERSLKNMALMMGLNEAEIVVRPPEDLMDQTLEPQAAKALVEMWQAGAFSHQTLDENLQRGGIRSTDRPFEDELFLIGDTDGDEQDVQDAAA